MSVEDLSGTTAIVTGASRGFGRSVATALTAIGATVVGFALFAMLLGSVHSRPRSFKRATSPKNS